MAVGPANDVKRQAGQCAHFAADLSAAAASALPGGSAISSGVLSGCIGRPRDGQQGLMLGQFPRAARPRVVVTHQHIAITAIEYGEIVVTVTSRFVGDDRSSSEIRPMPYLTSIAGGPLSGASWTSRTWSKALHNHVDAVGLVDDALISEWA